MQPQAHANHTRIFTTHPKPHTTHIFTTSRSLKQSVTHN